MVNDFKVARKRYLEKRNMTDVPLRAALIDMDGVLYDSMPWHSRAWHRMMTDAGVDCTVDEFFLYEGMTGPATINLLFRRAFGRDAGEDEIRRLYTKKGEIFKSFGKKPPIPGADVMLREFSRLGLRRILVTGSAQMSLLDSLAQDYPGAFLPGDRVTALDVTRGKPDPEPYLKGLDIACCRPEEAIVVENAPLGVRAGVSSGCFTVAVTTGPIPYEAFEKENPDMIFPSMTAFAEILTDLTDYGRTETSSGRT